MFPTVATISEIIITIPASSSSSNAPIRTTTGIRNSDVAIRAEHTCWQTILFFSFSLSSLPHVDHLFFHTSSFFSVAPLKEISRTHRFMAPLSRIDVNNSFPFSSYLKTKLYAFLFRTNVPTLLFSAIGLLFCHCVGFGHKSSLFPFLLVITNILEFFIFVNLPQIQRSSLLDFFSNSRVEIFHSTIEMKGKTFGFVEFSRCFTVISTGIASPRKSNEQWKPVSNISMNGSSSCMTRTSK